MHADHYDTLESRAPEQREAQLLTRLRECVAAARDGSHYYRETLSGIDPQVLTSREALATLPVTRKTELKELQSRMPPFGGLNTRDAGSYRRVFASPGPLFEPERLGEDPWRMARALYAAGARAGELIHNTFSYHFTPAGMMLDGAAQAMGCPVFAAGVGQSELQVQTIAALKPVFYTGTPSFLKILLDKAGELGVDVGSLGRGLVSGEALPNSLREAFLEQGVSLAQAYATADVGLIAYESPAREGLVVDEQVLVEIVRPGTGEPVAPGEVGEVLVTTLDGDYPMLRFATGDLSAEMEGTSPCGRTNRRIAGWMGRADQTTKVRGMFVHPSMVAEVVARCPGALKARLVVGSVDHLDTLTLECEVRAADGDELTGALADAVRDITKLRAEVSLCEAGALPNDGGVIVDRRSYD